MQVIHRLVGYDRRTDRPRVRFDVPNTVLPQAKRIAQVPEDDPEAMWSYPLSQTQARHLAHLIGAQIDPGESEFFLESFADSASLGRSSA